MWCSCPGWGSRAGTGALQGLKPQQEGRHHSLFVLAQPSLPPQRSCGASQHRDRVGGATLHSLPPELTGQGGVQTSFWANSCWHPTEELLAPNSHGQILSSVWAGLLLSGNMVWLSGCPCFLCGSFPRASHLYLLTTEESSLVLEPCWQMAPMSRPLWLGAGPGC